MRNRYTWVVVLVSVMVAITFVRRRRSTPTADVTAPRVAPPTPAPVVTPRMKREELRAKILTAILDEAGADEPPPPPRQDDEYDRDGGREARILTKGLTGVPATNFPTDYMAEIYRDQLGPMARACFDQARERRPDAGGVVSIRYVLVGAPALGAIVEDATVDESTLDDDELEECVHESVLTMTFDRAPDRGGWKEAGFVMQFGADSGD